MGNTSVLRVCDVPPWSQCGAGASGATFGVSQQKGVRDTTGDY